MTLTRKTWLPDLSHRALSVELMDDTTTDARLLYDTLRDFKYINKFVSRTRRVLRETVIADIQRRKAHDVSLLDIAAGGCDTGLWFARYCRSRGIACSVHCLDNDPRALSYAREACRDEPSIRFIQADARDVAGLDLKVDYVFTNHFLHHLSDQDIPILLRDMHNCCRYGFVVNDLHRHVAWYLGFTLLGGIFWRKGFTFADGRMSIRRGFTLNELKGHVTHARLEATMNRSGLGHWLITDIEPFTHPEPRGGKRQGCDPHRPLYNVTTGIG